MILSMSRWLLMLPATALSCKLPYGNKSKSWPKPANTTCSACCRAWPDSTKVEILMHFGERATLQSSAIASADVVMNQQPINYQSSGFRGT